jgi:hypothetical protein
MSVAIATASHSAAETLPPLTAPFDTRPIPGGVIKVYREASSTRSVEDNTLSAGNHQLRAYIAVPLGNKPGQPTLPTIYADGEKLIVGTAQLPEFAAVLTGGGRTYVRIIEGVDEDHPPFLWIVDVTAPKITVTRRIMGCELLKEAVEDGAYGLTCRVNGSTRIVSHTYKEGTLK